MSKELEVLKELQDELNKNYGNKYKSWWNERINVIKQALTPPTEQEVCEALSKHLDRVVKINSELSFYYIENRQYYGECDEIICGYSWKDKDISFEIDLPPRLITMIGRFYEVQTK